MVGASGSCRSCGALLRGNSRFCPACGAPVAPPSAQLPPLARGADDSGDTSILLPEVVFRCLDPTEIEMHADALELLEADVGLDVIISFLPGHLPPDLGHRRVLLAITPDEFLMAWETGELFGEPLSDVRGTQALPGDAIVIGLDDGSEIHFVDCADAWRARTFCEVLTMAIRSRGDAAGGSGLSERSSPADVASPKRMLSEPPPRRDRLLELEQLFGEGILTREEYDRRRAEIISEI